MTHKSIIKASQKAAALIDHCSLEDIKRMNGGWVARKVEVDQSYLSRSFKEDHGCYLKEYIERAKMNKARELLETTDLTVKEIAALLDYTNPGYFSSKFLQHKGMSPRRCREQYHARRQEQNKQPGAAVPANPIDSAAEVPLWQIFKERIIKHFKDFFE
jgi:AraC-like DNA-binding protein